jgi:hypothetical protein
MAQTTNGSLSAERLRELARAGAEVTLNRLRAEIAALEGAFPELAGRAGRRTKALESAPTAKRRRRRMSSAARKAVSDRMRRYWAARRKAQAREK